MRIASAVSAGLAALFFCRREGQAETPRDGLALYNRDYLAAPFFRPAGRLAASEIRNIVIFVETLGIAWYSWDSGIVATPF